MADAVDSTIVNGKEEMWLTINALLIKELRQKVTDTYKGV